MSRTLRPAPAPATTAAAAGGILRQQRCDELLQAGEVVGRQGGGARPWLTEGGRQPVLHTQQRVQAVEVVGQGVASHARRLLRVRLAGHVGFKEQRLDVATVIGGDVGEEGAR